MISVSITGSQGIILRASNDEVIYEDPDIVTTETEEPTETQTDDSFNESFSDGLSSGNENADADSSFQAGADVTDAQ